MKQVDESDIGREQEQQVAARLTALLADLANQEDVASLPIVELHENEILFAQGDEGDSVYLLRAGALGVRIKLADGSTANIARLAPGAIVGEMALLSGSRRSATVYALNDADLIRVSKEQFEQLMETDDAVYAGMSATAVPRWRRQQLLRALRKLLGDIDLAALEALLEQVEWHYFSNGDVVFGQDDPSDGMYLVVNGRLRTTLQREDGSQQPLGEIGAGEPAGEMGLLTDAPRSATVHAVRESNLVKITPAKFIALIRQHPQLMIHVARVIVERQQRIMRGEEPAARDSLTFAVLPGDFKVDANRFAQTLSQSFARLGSSLALNGGDFDEAYGEIMASQTELDGIGNTAIVAWMNNLDLAQQYLFYVADPFPSAWTRRCIAHADRALIVVDPRRNPQPGTAAEMLADLQVPLQSYLLFWPADQMQDSPDISRWLESRVVDGHFFVRDGDAPGMDELAEKLINN